MYINHLKNPSCPQCWDSNWYAMLWEKPDGACDVISMKRIKRSTSCAEAVMKPRRIPGARILDSESRRITLPSTSRLRNEGIRLETSCSLVCGVGPLRLSSVV